MLAPMKTTTEETKGLPAARLAYRSRSYLLRNPDVLGYGVGYRFRAGARTDEPALVVYVRQGTKSRDPNEVARHRRIPVRVRLPGRGRNRQLPTDLVETEVGELCASVTAAVTVCNCKATVEFGTVGWIARQADGAPVFCSCYHVLLPRRFQPPRKTQLYLPSPAAEELVTCPSPDFGGDLSLELGRVMRGIRSPTADLAIVEPIGAVALKDTIEAIGSMGKPRVLSSFNNPPGTGESVQVAVGHHGPIRGFLAEFPARFVVQYPDFPEYELRNLIMAITDPPVRPGDSGALLIDNDRRPLGMLVGREGVTGRSYYMPIAAIMALNLVPFTS